MVFSPIWQAWALILRAIKQPTQGFKNVVKMESLPTWVDFPPPLYLRNFIVVNISMGSDLKLEKKFFLLSPYPKEKPSMCIPSYLLILVSLLVLPWPYQNLILFMQLDTCRSHVLLLPHSPAAGQVALSLEMVACLDPKSKCLDPESDQPNSVLDFFSKKFVCLFFH